MEKIIIILGATGLAFILAILMALPTMFLWNWLMPVIFGLIKINFWQAFGLNLLGAILFNKSSK